MKILEVLFDTDVVHEFDQHHSWVKLSDDLSILDASDETVAEYNWNDVVYVRYTEKADAEASA